MRMNEQERRVQLEELEKIWLERFEYQPKLPSSALLTGAVAMALGFGAVLFLLAAPVRRYAWIFIVLSIAFSSTNRVLAKRWYNRVVLPWSAERAAFKSRIDALRASCSDSSGNTPGGSDRV